MTSAHEAGVSPTAPPRYPRPALPHPCFACLASEGAGFAEPTLGDVGGEHRAAPGIRAGRAHRERLPWTLKEVAAPWGPGAFSEWQILVRIHTEFTPSISSMQTDFREARVAVL